jgi:hypothetical protein
VTAEHWINLRGTTYAVLEEFFSKKVVSPSTIDLYKLFDEAEHEVLNLLESSWDRFQTSAEYIAEADDEFSVSNKSRGHSMTSKAYGNTDRYTTHAAAVVRETLSDGAAGDDEKSSERSTSMSDRARKVRDSAVTPFLGALKAQMIPDVDISQLSAEHSADIIVVRDDSDVAEKAEDDRAVRFAVELVDEKDALIEESRQDKASGQQLEDSEIEDYSDEEVGDYARCALAKMASQSDAYRSQAVLTHASYYEADAVQPTTTDVDTEADSQTRGSFLAVRAMPQYSTSDLPAMSMSALAPLRKDSRSRTTSASGSASRSRSASPSKSFSEPSMTGEPTATKTDLSRRVLTSSEITMPPSIDVRGRSDGDTSPIERANTEETVEDHSSAGRDVTPTPVKKLTFDETITPMPETSAASKTFPSSRIGVSLHPAYSEDEEAYGHDDDHLHSDASVDLTISVQSSHSKEATVIHKSEPSGST